MDQKYVQSQINQINARIRQIEEYEHLQDGAKEKRLEKLNEELKVWTNRLQVTTEPPEE